MECTVRQEPQQTVAARSSYTSIQATVLISTIMGHLRMPLERPQMPPTGTFSARMPSFEATIPPHASTSDVASNSRPVAPVQVQLSRLFSEKKMLEIRVIALENQLKLQAAKHQKEMDLMT